MISLSITFMIINIIIIYLVFRGLNRFIQPRISRVIGFRLFIAYGVILLMSPIIVSLALDLDTGPEEASFAPDSYYASVLYNYENLTLEDLIEDEYLHLGDQTALPIYAFDFSEDQPLIISPQHQGKDYAFYTIIEVTDEVETPMITQFIPRSDILGIDITEEYPPWKWTITGNRLQAEIERFEMDIYIVNAIHHYFHFDRERTSSHHIFHQSFNNIGTIQWIQIPADLPYKLLGEQDLFRIIER